MMKREHLLAALIILLAAALRFYDITFQSLWGDEAFSIYAARGVDMHFMTASLVDATHRKFLNPHGTPRDLLTACIRNEGAPPAYYAVLAVWIKLFGGSDCAVRSLSAVVGSCAVAAIFLLGRLLFRRADTALLAALLLAVSPINIFFSQEVRAYIFANFAALLSSWLLLRAMRDNVSTAVSWGAYGIAALLLLYSFYFATLTLLAHFLYLLCYERSKIRPWLRTMAVVGFLYLPWCLVGLTTQLHVTSGYAPPGPASARQFLSACLTSTRYILDSLILGPMYSRVIMGDRVRLVIEFGLLLLLSAGSVRLWSRGERRALMFPLLLFLVPLAVIASYGWLKGTLWYMKPRYHFWEASGILLLAAASITAFRSRTAKVTLSTSFCAFSLLAAPYHFYPGVFASDHAKDDFRAAAAIITGGEQRGDIILVNIAGHMIPFNIYYKGGLRQVGISECGDYNLLEKLEQYTRARTRVWLLIGLSTTGRGDAQIASFLDRRFPHRKEYALQGLRLVFYSSGEGGA